MGTERKLCLNRISLTRRPFNAKDNHNFFCLFLLRHRVILFLLIELIPMNFNGLNGLTLTLECYICNKMLFFFHSVSNHWDYFMLWLVKVENLSKFFNWYKMDFLKNSFWNVFSIHSSLTNLFFWSFDDYSKIIFLCWSFYFLRSWKKKLKNKN